MKAKNLTFIVEDMKGCGMTLMIDIHILPVDVLNKV